MKTKNDDDAVPSPLREVWAWKDAVYHTTKEMSTAEALTWMHSDADAIRKAFGLSVSEPGSGSRRVAESPTGYGKSG